MSVVKINAITPAEGAEAELEARFGNRAREVEHMEGFEDFSCYDQWRARTATTCTLVGVPKRTSYAG